MTVPQIFGNWLACTLMRLSWGVRYTDLGPFRAIRYDSLKSLGMSDRDFGWTVEMQIKAARAGTSFEEVPVPLSPANRRQQNQWDGLGNNQGWLQNFVHNCQIQGLRHPVSAR